MAALSAAILAASVLGGVIAGKRSAGSGPTATPPLPVVPPAPKIDVEGMQTAAAVNRARADASMGQASTILTGPMGTAPAATSKKTLLGG